MSSLYSVDADIAGKIKCGNNSSLCANAADFAVSGNVIYTTLDNQPTAYISSYNFDTKTLRSSSFITTQYSYNLYAYGNFLYVTYLVNLAVYNISSPATYLYTVSITGGPKNICMSPDGTIVYVSVDNTYNAAGVYAYNATTLSKITTFNAGLATNNNGYDAICVANNILYMSDSVNLRITTLNATTGAIIQSSFIGSIASNGLDISNNKLFVSVGGRVEVYNASNGTFISTLYNGAETATIIRIYNNQLGLVTKSRIKFIFITDTTLGTAGNVVCSSIDVFESLSCGLVTCGAITASGSITATSQTVTCGAITASGAITATSQTVTCGAITASGLGTFTSGINVSGGPAYARNGTYGFLNSVGVGYFDGGGVSSYQLAVTGRIGVNGEVNCWSDKRIKTNIKNISNDSLEIIRKLEPVKFNYIDFLKNEQNKDTIGFIAQDIFDVLPEAVSKTTDIIPNIYDVGTLILSDIITLKTKKTSDFSFDSSPSENIKIKIFVNDKEEFVYLEKIIDEYTFRLTNPITTEITDNSENQIFVYGQEVNDLLTIEKNAIFTMAVGAIKELDAELKETRATVKKLQEQVEFLMSKF